MDFDSVSVYNHAKKELGQYPTILTSHFVNNPYIKTLPRAGTQTARSGVERTTRQASVSKRFLQCNFLLAHFCIEVKIGHRHSKNLSMDLSNFVFLDQQSVFENVKRLKKC